MNKKLLAILIVIVVVVVGFLIYYFRTRKITVQYYNYGTVTTKTVTLTEYNPVQLITTQIIAGNNAEVSITAQPSGFYAVWFTGAFYNFSNSISFISNPITSSGIRTLTLTGSGMSTYYKLLVNFIAYPLSVTGNGVTLTKTQTNTTIYNVTTLNLTLTSAPLQTYIVTSYLYCPGFGLISKSSFEVVTQNNGATTFTIHPTSYVVVTTFGCTSSLAGLITYPGKTTYTIPTTVQTEIHITGPGIPYSFKITVINKNKA